MTCDTCPNRKIATKAYCKYVLKCQHHKELDRKENYYSAMYSVKEKEK